MSRTPEERSTTALLCCMIADVCKWETVEDRCDRFGRPQYCMRPSESLLHQKVIGWLEEDGLVRQVKEGLYCWTEKWRVMSDEWHEQR